MFNTCISLHALRWVALVELCWLVCEERACVALHRVGLLVLEWLRRANCVGSIGLGALRCVCCVGCVVKSHLKFLPPLNNSLLRPCILNEVQN